MRRLTTGTARRFLEVAGGIMPQVTPRNRGRFEAWAGGDWQKRDEHRLDWPGRKPCYDGSAFAQTHPEWPSPPGVAAWTISVSLDEETVRASARMREQVVELFTSVAAEVGAFYGACYVEREWILEGRSLWADSLTNERSQVYIPTWKGLPRRPMWLSWFGVPYRDLVQDAVGSLGAQLDHGLFLRLGELPSESDEVATAFPHLPEHLTQDSRPVAEIKGGGTSRSFHTVHDRAAYIPDLE
jgi:hypothetical protein